MVMLERMTRKQKILRNVQVLWHMLENIVIWGVGIFYKTNVFIPFLSIPNGKKVKKKEPKSYILMQTDC